MSHAATNWAIKQRGIKPASKIVLWHLCDRFHSDNGCFPSQELLAEDCEMSRSSLNAHLNVLETRGLIVRETRRDPETKQQERTRYRFPFEPDFVAKTADEGAEGPCPESEHGSESEKGQEPSPENEQSRVRNSDTNPVREPVTEPSVERDARAGDPEPDPESDQDFQLLRGKVAKVRGPQAIGRSFPIWLRLEPAARALALNGWETCLAAWSQGGQKHAYGLETYLRDRMWEQVTAPAGDVPKVVLALRSGEWFAFFWSAWIARDLKTCASMIRMAKIGSGYGCPAAEIPSSDAIQAMPRVKLDSPEWTAWRRLLERDDLRISYDTIVPAWVWVPSEWPQEDEKTAMAG